MRYVTNPFFKIPVNEKSHVLGWSDYWARMLDAEIYRGDFSDIKPKDELYIDHGVNFSGGLNLFGGLTDNVALRLVNFSKLKCRVTSLDGPMPDYGAMLRSRLNKSSTSKWFTEKVANDLKKLFFKGSNSFYIDSLSLNKPWLTIGDSHATSFARPDSAVIRTNGKTLYGFLKDNTHSSFNYDMLKGYKGVTFVFGSVDIRHHLMRQPNPKISLRSLLNNYDLFIIDLLNKRKNFKVEIAAPVPVEYEKRKIPKTGYYDGTPFYGNLDERKKLTSTFIKHILASSIYKAVAPPKEWYHMDPEQYAKTYMELNSSVHIAPIHYRYHGGW